MFREIREIKNTEERSLNNRVDIRKRINVDTQYSINELNAMVQEEFNKAAQLATVDFTKRINVEES